MSTDARAKDADERWACEVSGLNYAWGYYHAGIYIDPQGSIGEFKYGPSDSRWAPNRGQPMTLAELREKYRPGNRIIGNVCPEQMLWLRDELNKARYSPSSKPVHSASDAGTQLTQCWMFESESKPGQNIRLRETGDFESRNLAETAPALANWIEAVAQDAAKDAHIPLTEKGCIAYPESLHEQYDDTIRQTDAQRDQAMKLLTTAEGLRCRMGEGHWAAVYGTRFQQRPTPENFESNYFQLDFEKGTGRLSDGGREVYDVSLKVHSIGVTLEDNPMDGQEVRRTTVVPYKIGGQNNFPAVMQEVMYDEAGLVSTMYVGSCTAIPAS